MSNNNRGNEEDNSGKEVIKNIKEFSKGFVEGVVETIKSPGSLASLISPFLDVDAIFGHKKKD